MSSGKRNTESRGRAMHEMIRDLKISTIKIGTQFRKEMGDLEELAESIRQGLLQPIGITPKRELVFGYRRLLACRDVLKFKTIPTQVVDVPSILEGMLTENTMRKDFTISERVAVFRALKAEIGNRKGKRTDLQPREKIPEVKPGERTDDFAAKRAGLGNRRTAEQAERAIDAGVSELVEAMDRGEVSISAATEVASLPPQEQQEVLKVGCDQGRLVARQIRQHKQQKGFQERQLAQQKVLARGPGNRTWSITASQKVVRCAPPYCGPALRHHRRTLGAREPRRVHPKMGQPMVLLRSRLYCRFFSQDHMWRGRNGWTGRSGATSFNRRSCGTHRITLPRKAGRASNDMGADLPVPASWLRATGSRPRIAMDGRTA